MTENDEQQSLNGNTLKYRVGEVEKEVELLAKKVDHLIWSILGLSLTIAGSAAGFALTVLVLRGR